MVLFLQSGSWWEWLSKLATEVQQSILESINSMITGIFGRLPLILAGVVVLLIFWLLSKLVRKIFLVATRRTTLDTRLRLLISRILVVVVVGLGILTSFTLFFPSFTFGDMIAGLGFSSIVIGFATKDILNNFLSGILILWQRPFHIGDYLFVGNNQGKVEYIGVRATSLRKDDGELILIPNGDMYSSALTIRGKGAKRRMNMKFCIGYDEALEQTKEIARKALDGIEGIVVDPPARVLVSEMISDGVNITVSFWINTNETKPLEVYDRAAIAIIESLENAGVEVFPAA